MATDTIKEFLVKLGFQVDEAALKKFNTGIVSVTKSVFALGAAVEGLAVSIAYGVERFSQDLEQLYFASQRTKASAENIKALDTAAQNFGATAGEAKASLEAFAHFLRANPTGEAVVRMFGIKTRDKNGRVRDTSEMLVDLGEQFQKMPVWMALQRGQMLGLSENTILALSNPEYRAEYTALQKTLKDSGFAQSTRDAHLFMEQLRSLETVVEAFGARVATAIGQQLGVTMKDIIDWMNNPKNVERTKNLLLGIVSAAQSVGSAFNAVADVFIRLDTATDGLSTKLLIFGGIMKSLGIFSLIGTLAKLFGITGGAAGGLTLAEAAAAAEGVEAPAVVAAAAPGALAVGAGATGLIGLAGAAGYGLSKVMNFLGDQKMDATKFFMSAGWTKEQAAGIVANLARESGDTLDPHAMGDQGTSKGIAQWHKTATMDRQKDYERWAAMQGGGVGRTLDDASRQDQLRFLQWDLTEGGYKSVGNLIRAQNNIAGSSAAFLHGYEGSKYQAADQKKNLSIAQSIVININGSGLSEKQLKDAIKGGLSDANSSAVRSAANGMNM